MKMKHILVSSIVISGLFLLGATAFAQCGAPEVVKGATAYNNMVCKAWAASQEGDQTKALGFFLAASEQPVLESPNIRLFGEIATTYAKLGRFSEADLYLQYENISVLWMIGIVRCQAVPYTDGEGLFQDGKRLRSPVAKHMSSVLCGPIFDEYSYFRDRDAETFVPAANEILQFQAVRKEIARLKKQSSITPQ
jgi:hypothetical protein